MSKFLLLSLVILVSCVSEQKTPDTVGNTKRYEPVTVTFEDNERIQAICRALSSKEDVLNVLANSGLKYTFDYAQKDCNSNLGETKPVVTKIAMSGQNYVFQPQNGEDFAFTDVESYSQGVMKEICQNVGSSLMSPMQSSTTGAIWFTSYTAADHCQSDANGICMHIQRGSVVDGLDYQIHTNEWIKFSLNDAKKGFFVERKFISSVGCSARKNIERRATLR